jgi:hypothetical protein
MMSLSMDRPICAQHAGGMHMSTRPSSCEVQVAPVQVWPALSSDLRTRIVGLLAQLALNMVAAHSDNASTTKEATCANPAPLFQNPSRPS